MNKSILFAGIFVLTLSAYSLPTYDSFSTYGGVNGTMLGGSNAPSGETWVSYTNGAAASLTGTNVCLTNYFVGSGSVDSLPAGYNLPSGFAGPHVSGHDTSANSIWTPGYPGVNSALGGLGACLKFANPVLSGPSNTIYASFFVDVPACQGNGDTYGQGQSLGWGWTAGFLDANVLPSPTANQYAIPAVDNFEKFNARYYSATGGGTEWKPGIGDNNATSGTGTQSFGSGEPQATIYFIVIAYEWSTNGIATNDQERIWFDPAASTFGALTEPSDSVGKAVSGSANHLADVSGFFFLSFCENDAALPASGIIYNSLSVGTNWAYVTGGPQFTSYAPASTNISSGQTLVLNSTALAGGGVTPTYAWQTNNGVNSGPLITGGRFSVGPTGALTITGVQPGDAGTYTLQVSTPITTENSVPPSTAQTVVTVSSPPAFTSENASGIGSGQFQMNFSGPVGASYRIWTTTNLALSPVTSTWTPVYTNTFTSGVNTFTDMSATKSAQFYIITVP